MAENEEIAVENIDENDGLLQDTTVETRCQDMKDTFDNREK